MTNLHNPRKNTEAAASLSLPPSNSSMRTTEDNGRIPSLRSAMHHRPAMRAATRTHQRDHQDCGKQGGHLR